MYNVKSLSMTDVSIMLVMLCDGLRHRMAWPVGQGQVSLSPCCDIRSPKCKILRFTRLTRIGPYFLGWNLLRMP